MTAALDVGAAENLTHAAREKAEPLTGSAASSALPTAGDADKYAPAEKDTAPFSVPSDAVT